MIIYLYRHGMTNGNLEKRYIGTTDEPLSLKGMEVLKGKKTPEVERVYVSPLLRCRQTADILFPGVEQQIITNFRECDFGLFENKNYQELQENHDYQKWLDSMGTLPFPGGESREAFSKRCCDAFFKVLKTWNLESPSAIAMVVHGGTIMSIMERAALPPGQYYDFQIENGGCYQLTATSEGFLYRTYD